MNNPTILTLLKAGATIEFPSGYKFRGDPQTRYIDLITPYGNDGLVLLNKAGVNEAFKYKKIFEREEAKG